MVLCSLQNLNKILDHFDPDLPTIDSTTTTQIATNFGITPEEFLGYAEKDLKIDDKHHLINSLSNVKRGIECQIDSLLIGFGLYNKSKKEKWNFPKKIQLLNDIGIVSPRILEKINKHRNLLEHEYLIPEREKVEDALDVAILFIQYTNKYIYNTIIEFSLAGVSKDSDLFYPEVILDYQNSKIIFDDMVPETPERKSFNRVKDEIDVNNPEYLQYLIWFLKMIQKRERER